MADVDRGVEIRIAEQAALYRQQDSAFARWAAGYGRMDHTPETLVRVAAMADLLRARGAQGDGVPVFELRRRPHRERRHVARGP